jgi:hypothetical protein
MIQYRWISFLLSVGVLLMGCGNPDKEIPSENFEKLKTLIREMESEGGRMAQQLDTVAHFYSNLLNVKDSILKNPKPNPYRFQGAVSANIPGEDSTLSTIIILNTTPDRKAALQEVLLTNILDSVFSAFKKNNPLAVQIYSNSAIQVSRVFPAYDAKNIVDPDLDVTQFNFYYEADLVHNPQKGLVWIPDPYVDPAGKGWILSLLHPVYDGNELFAVLGVDYTVSDIIEKYLSSVDGEFVLVNVKGDIVAGKGLGIETLSLPPLKNHVYRETIQSDNFRISDFNLFNSKSREVRKMAQEFLLQKKDRFVFEDEPNLNQAICVPFPTIGWFLIEVFPNF